MALSFSKPARGNGPVCKSERETTKKVKEKIVLTLV
jgi:hypothetical protein